LKRCSSERGEREKRFYGSNQNAEFVKVPLRVVKVPPAAPERSAGYDASLGCPGAAPLLPGAPAIRRNSVTEAQLHRAVARARCGGLKCCGAKLTMEKVRIGMTDSTFFVCREVEVRIRMRLGLGLG